LRNAIVDENKKDICDHKKKLELFTIAVPYTDFMELGMKGGERSTNSGKNFGWGEGLFYECESAV
jgi:hypothetical protein